MCFELVYIYSHDYQIHNFHSHNLHKPFPSTSLKPLFNFISFNNIMNPQQQQVEASQQVATQTATPSTTTYQEPHVLDLPPNINLATSFEKH